MRDDTRDRYYKEIIRGAIPGPMIPAVVAARYRGLRARRHAEGLEAMQFLLGTVRADADFDELADAYTKCMIWRSEMKWHPTKTTRQPVTGVQDATAVRDSGRGVVVNFAHHGQYDGMFGSLARAGLPCHVVADTRWLQPEAPPHMKHHVRVVGIGGAILDAAIGSQGITDALKRGHSVAIASDLASRTPVYFAGRTVYGSFGAARLAFEWDVPVVVVTSHRGSSEWDPQLRVSDPIEPRGFPDAETLLQHMVSLHEAAIMAWPEAYEYPTRRWGATSK